jgi:hypothetical protein
VEVTVDNGVISFSNRYGYFENGKERFHIQLYIPDKTKLYFKPPSWWASKNNVSGWFLSSVLTDQKDSFDCNNSLGTKSVMFQPPFFLVFKTSSDTSSNYLSFNNMLTTNSENTILAMLVYNEERESFQAEFSPGITLPYFRCLSLNNTLEFKLFDSKNTLIPVSDKSQLFISLTIL